MNIRVLLVKIQGHSDILGNEIADKEAKLIASQMSESNIVSTDKGLMGQWDNKSTGRYTYNLIPIVGTKVTFSKERHVGIAYSRMLLHDTMLMKDSFHSGTSDTPLCHCEWHFGPIDSDVGQITKLLYAGPD